MLRKTFVKSVIHGLASRPISAVMQPLRSKCVPVFMLHRIADPKLGIRGHSLTIIEQALSYLASNGYTGISIQDLVQALIDNKPVPPRSVAFTLDDGFHEQATLALPLFERYKMPATLFLATDMLDKQSWSWDYQVEFIINSTTKAQVDIILAETPFSAVLHDDTQKRYFTHKLQEHLKSVPIRLTFEAVEHLSRTLAVTVPKIAPAGYLPMTWEQARALESEYIQFGPHTRQHIVLTQMGDIEAREEIIQSWQRLQDQLKHPVPVFCYPTGRPQIDFGTREQQMVRDAGMIAGLSAMPGYVDVSSQQKDDIFSLKRFSFTDNFTDFIQYCSWIERAKEIVFFRTL